MKNSSNDGFDQHYNVQVATDQESLLIVAHTLSNHPNDKQEAVPTLEAISPKIGKPQAAALDNGYFREANIQAIEQRDIDPYITTGREPHHQDWRSFFQEQPTPPAEDASATVKMASKLRTEIGQAIYRLRKCTVEPVIGIIKEILGFRQFSLRGLTAAAGEWCLVCLAFRLRREAYAYPVSGTRAVLTRLQVEKRRNQSDDPYSLIPFSTQSPVDSFRCGNDSSHYACLSDRLLGVINSKLATWYLQNLLGMAIEINPDTGRRLPIRRMDFGNPSEKSAHDEIVKLVERMLALQKERQSVRREDDLDRVRNLERQIAQVDAQIDQRVYALYGLSPDEIIIVEGKE